MAQSIRDIMTPTPVALDVSASVADAAQAMRDADVGDVLVERDGNLCGIVTDRDLVVRCIALGDDPRARSIGDLCSRELQTLEVGSTVDAAIETMRSAAIRRVPVVENGRAVGIVSLGDLAIERDARSVLGGISSAPPSI